MADITALQSILNSSVSTTKGNADLGNPYGVRTTSLQAGATQTQTYHGVQIQFNNNVVGRLASWAPQMYSRAGVHIFELGVLSYGRPVDYVPGNASTFSITATRAELWGNEIEKVAGFSIFNDLVSQKSPFEITETLFKGEDVYRSWIFYTCWFSEKQLSSFDAEGDAKVIVSCSINFVSRQIVGGTNK